MRRLPYRVAVAVLLAFVCSGAVAQDRSDDPFAGSPFRAEMSAQILISPFSVYASVSPNVVVTWWWLGVGLGTKLYTGLSQQDLYVAPYLRLDFLWFYLAGGYSFPLLQPIALFPARMEPFVSAGFSMAPLRFAYGWLGFDLTLDMVATAAPFDISSSPSPTDLESFLNYVLVRVKAAAGLTYRFPL